MLPRTLRAAPLIAGVMAISASFFGAAALADSLALDDTQRRYMPIQNISQNFGSKSMSGYFISQDTQCLVTLMVIEKSNPEAPPLQTATRVRLMLRPGEVAGLDSEEGRSLNVTCGQEAASLILDVGDRDRLVARQNLARRENVAKRELSLAH